MRTHTRAHRQANILIPHALLHHQTTAERKSQSKESQRNRRNKSEKEALKVEGKIKASVSARGGGAHRSVHIHDQLPPGLVALAVVGSLLLLLQDALAGGPVLQRKLAEDFAEPVDADLSHAVGGVTEVQQEGMEPGS